MALRSPPQLVDDMAIALGRRAAEELAFGEPDAGPADDLDRATAIPRTMVTRLGMSATAAAMNDADLFLRTSTCASPPAPTPRW